MYGKGEFDKKDKSDVLLINHVSYNSRIIIL